MSSHVGARANAFMNRLRSLQESNQEIDCVGGENEFELASDVVVIGVEHDGLVTFFSDDLGSVAVYAGDIRKLEYQVNVVVGEDEGN